MNITHTPEDQIIELDGSTFDPTDPPTAAELSDMLEDDGFEVDGGPVRFFDVQYTDGRWVAEYQSPSTCQYCGQPTPTMREPGTKPAPTDHITCLPKPS